MTETAARMPERRLMVLASKPWGMAPNQRFRIEQWAPRLKRDHGIEVALFPFESPRLSDLLYRPGHTAAKAALVLTDFIRRAGILGKVHDFDAVVVCREAALLGPAIYERLITWLGKPIIIDFDDSIWIGSQFRNNGIFTRLHFYGKTGTLCRIAAACTPGNAFLADYARQRNPNTFVVPTSIELRDYPVIPEPPSDRPFIICWTGSTSTLPHFEHARRPLERLAAQIPLAVKVICNKPPERPIAGAENLFVPWSADGEGRALGACHVGIMPLPDDEFNRGKCGLKALQFMATGKPVIVSPVGVNIEIVKTGDNGFVASSDDEFIDAAIALARSPDLRRTIGARARRTVETRYSAELASARFASVVRFVTDQVAP